MKIFLNMLFILLFVNLGNIHGESPNISSNMAVHDVDYKNVLAKVKNLIILRSFESSIWGKNINSRKSYLEAYDTETGELVWCHQNTGMIVSFVVINDEKIIYRNYNGLTAISIDDGSVIWAKKTKGQYSTNVGE